jgi:hypothetical protein
VDAAVDKFMRRAVGGAARFVAPVSPGILQNYTGERDRKQAVKKYAKQLAALGADPQRLADNIAAETAELEPHAPEVAKTLAATRAKATAFLMEKAPKPPEDVMLQPNVDLWQVPTADAARFERYVTAALDPYSVFDDIASGTITPEAVETLQAVYPSLYEVGGTHLLEAVASLGKPLSYSARAALSLYLGQPVDPALYADTVSRAQQQYQSPPEKKTPGPSPSPEIDTFNTMAPQSQQIQKSLMRA